MYYSTCITCARLQKLSEGVFQDFLFRHSIFRPRPRSAASNLGASRCDQILVLMFMINKRHCDVRLRNYITIDHLKRLGLNDVGIRLLSHEHLIHNLVSCFISSPYLRRDVLSIWLCLSLDRLLRCTGLRDLLLLDRLLGLLRYTLLGSLFLRPSRFFVLLDRG